MTKTKEKELIGTNPIAHIANDEYVHASTKRLQNLNGIFGSSGMMQSLSSNHDNNELANSKNKSTPFVYE